jgi:hypothetical protein
MKYHPVRILKTKYSDQPFVSETTRCESVDFIQKIDDQDKKPLRFYVWRMERGKELTSRENEKRKWERQSLGEKGIAWVQRSGHSHKQIMEM